MMHISRAGVRAVLLCAAAIPGISASDAAGSRYAWPEPRYKVRVEEGAKIPMRDGVRLATDLYFPVEAGNRIPVILIRTPYNKAPYREQKSAARQFAGQGYVVAVQDTRGRHASEGEFTAFAGDVTDGYDTTDWLSRQPWSNGKVGLMAAPMSGMCRFCRLSYDTRI